MASHHSILLGFDIQYVYFYKYIALLSTGRILTLFLRLIRSIFRPEQAKALEAWHDAEIFAFILVLNLSNNCKCTPAVSVSVLQAP